MCELLKTRRSVRKYRPEQVPDALLDAVLEAGLYAPSAMNNQKPVMVAVRDKATRDQLSRMNAAVMGTDRDPFYGAPCVIVVLADPGYRLVRACRKEGLLNAAHAEHLGSCWINRAREMFDTQEGKALLGKWGVPEHYRGIGCCILGYADENPAPKERAANRILKI